VISLVHGGLLFLLLPTLPPVAALALSHWSFYRQEDEDEPDRIFESDAVDAEAHGDRPQSGRSPMLLPVAFTPYIFLGVIAVVVLSVTPIRSVLETVSVGPPFPDTLTAYGVREAVEAHHTDPSG
jgi:hypothetical protein